MAYQQFFLAGLFQYATIDAKICSDTTYKPGRNSPYYRDNFDTDKKMLLNTKNYIAQSM